MAQELTAKQRRFADEYLIDCNAKQAAIRAGYSPHTAEVQGCRLLRYAHVTAAIAEGQKKLAERAGISADKVIAELARIGFSDIRKAVKWYSQTEVATVDNDADCEALAEEGALRFAVANQVELISSDEVDDDTAAAISEVSMSSTGALKVKMYDKRAALVDLGRHLGIFANDGINVNVNVGVGLGAFYGDAK